MVQSEKLNQYIFYPKNADGTIDKNHGYVFYGKNRVEAIADMVNWYSDCLKEIRANKNKIKDSTFDDEWLIRLSQKNFKFENNRRGRRK